MAGRVPYRASSCPNDYFATRITPKPIFLRSRSGYLSRAFSACSLVLKGLESGVNSPLMYRKSSHRSVGFDMDKSISD